MKDVICQETTQGPQPESTDKVQPVLVSRKINLDLKVEEKKPQIVNQQRQVTSLFKSNIKL